MITLVWVFKMQSRKAKSLNRQLDLLEHLLVAAKIALEEYPNLTDEEFFDNFIELCGTVINCLEINPDKWSEKGSEIFKEPTMLRVYFHIIDSDKETAKIIAQF